MTMRFWISRTSSWEDYEQPCPEAQPEMVLFTYSWCPDGDGNQPNHRTAIGFNYIHCWHVDLDSLEDLEHFVEKYGKVVIRKGHYLYPDDMCIEIYDDYRE